MKPASKTWKPEGTADTPYRKAQREWDERMGSSLVQAKNWRLATFAVLLLVALPSILGMVYLGAQPKAVPHIVEVNTDGSSVYRGAVGASWKEFKPGDASIRYHLGRFVNNTRMVSSDKAVIKRNWLDAYNLVTPKAANTLNAYAEKNEPFQRADRERVSVDILSMVPISGESWQIDWKESRWGNHGDAQGESWWRGIFRVVMHKPESEEQLAANPVGLYIDEFHWSKIQR